MSTEIASAYIALTTRMPGVKKDIATAIGGAEPEADKAGSNVGTRFTDAFGKVAKVGMATVAGVGALALGAALTKGFERLNTIDQAQAKLRGLGNDADTVDVIMENALASVKGTAFGLGDAATVAAQAVAAGIQPGEQLQGVLDSVANSAAAAGTDLGDMGSIFAKVASTGKAQNDVLQQVADRGIPIYQALADQLGVTTEEVFKMASAGEIGFDQFNQAMSAASGDVAAEMGTTFQGRLDNMFAALGRIGEGILQGVFPQMKDGLTGLTTALDDVMPVARSVGEALGQVTRFVSENISLIVALAAGVTAGVIAWKAYAAVMLIAKAYTAAQAAATGGLTVAQWAFNAAASANPIGLIILAIAALIAIIVLLVMNWDTVVKWITDVWGTFISWITSLIEGFVGWWNGIWAAVGQWISDVWNGIVTAVTNYINMVLYVVQAVGMAISNWWSNLWSGIGSFFSGIWEGIIGAIRTVQGVFGAVFNAIGDIVRGAFDGVVSIVRGVINGIIDAVNGVIGGINGVAGAIGGAIGVNISIPRIPRLATGGIIQGSSTGTLALVGEAGRGRDEAVIPLPPDWKQNGLGGGTVNQYITVAETDARVQARQWAREAERAFASS